MKKGHIYTLVFMLALSTVLTLALALAYEGFKPNIAAHDDLKKERSVLYALGLDEGLTDEQVTDTFAKVVEPVEGQGYVYKQDGQVRGYAVPFTGAGLWGSITGYAGLSGEKDKLTGIVFTKQNETPGLGGRIDETEYREQFRGLPIAPGTLLSYGQHDGYRLDGITGATQTSNAVIRIINQMLSDHVFNEGVQ